MEVVRQSHLPGNYETYDEVSNSTGVGVCKYCWEDAHTVNGALLVTVWLSAEGRDFIWWLCEGHYKRASEKGTMHIQKVEKRAVRNPAVLR